MTTDTRRSIHRATSLRWLTFAALLAASMLASTAVAESKATVATAGGAEASEHSVKPGINDKYLSPDLDVDSWVERFEGESRQIFNHRNEIAATLGLAPGAVVADIGAGTGLFTRIFAEQVGDAGRIYAVEISPRFLEHLRAMTRVEKLAQVEVIEGGDRSAHLPAASTDVIFICDVYHHFEYPRAMLASLRDALRPGGKLVLLDFHRIPGKSEDWILDHVRAGEEVFRAEIEEAGFVLEKEVTIAGLDDNYVLQFARGAD